MEIRIARANVRAMRLVIVCNAFQHYRSLERPAFLILMVHDFALIVEDLLGKDNHDNSSIVVNAVCWRFLRAPYLFYTIINQCYLSINTQELF